jgi:hypothetical protein
MSSIIEKIDSHLAGKPLINEAKSGYLMNALNKDLSIWPIKIRFKNVSNSYEHDQNGNLTIDTIDIFMPYFNALTFLEDAIEKRLRLALSSSKYRVQHLKPSVVTGSIKDVQKMLEKIKSTFNGKDDFSGLDSSSTAKLYRFIIELNDENDINKLEQIIG